MRWDNLTVEAEEAARLPGYRDGAVVRRFDAPEAMDIRFYEVHAKSALNKVPESSLVPFRWTINPYRGCSHACTYCLAGDTPVLLADGTSRQIRHLQPGDEIYGTEGEGAHRRYAVTRVLDRWRTIKPAYRVTLEDGVSLVASGDHRFLTTRGWKHVVALQQGRSRRPHLTLEDRILGIGAVSEGSAAVAGGGLAGVAVTTAGARRVVSIERVAPAMRLYDITTASGDFLAKGVISHNCFARPTHKYLDFDAGRDFEREIVVKVNVPEVLRAELRRPSWRGEHVALGTNTDPYQWVEGRYRLMPGILEALRDFRNPCSVLTKSPLVLRDLALLKEIAEVADVSVNFSVPTLDEKAWRASEPHTPHPRARLEAMGELNRAGIPSGILVAPLMPGINDAPEQVEKILELAAENGATGITPIALHLRGDVRTVFMDWLRSYRPDLVAHYERLYGTSAYASKAERQRLADLVRRGTVPTWPSASRDHRGARRVERRPGPEEPRREVQAPLQQALF